MSISKRLKVFHYQTEANNLTWGLAQSIHSFFKLAPFVPEAHADSSVFRWLVNSSRFHLQSLLIRPHWGVLLEPGHIAQHLPSFTELRDLELHNIFPNSNIAIEQLFNSIASLRQLRTLLLAFSPYSTVSEAEAFRVGLKRVFLNCPDIVQIDLKGCESVTEEILLDALDYRRDVWIEPSILQCSITPMVCYVVLNQVRRMFPVGVNVSIKEYVEIDDSE